MTFNNQMHPATERKNTWDLTQQSFGLFTVRICATVCFLLRVPLNKKHMLTWEKKQKQKKGQIPPKRVQLLHICQKVQVH